MSHDLQEHLDRYSADAAREVGVDPAGAWRSGRRRRRARRVALAGAAAALATGAVVLTIAAPGNLSSEPAANRPGVDEHPVRIADSWFTGDLEADSGPMAGFLVTEGDERFAVTESGEVLEIPQGDTTGDFLPALSSDGTKLGYLRDSTTYVLQDLANGTVVELDGLGDNRDPSTLPYMTQGQTPGFWSPDGEQLLITGWRTESRSADNLVLGLDGTISVVPKPRRPPGDGGFGQAAGWADGEHLGWVQLDGPKGSRALTYVVTDLDGVEVSRTRLDVGARNARLSQWSGNLSDDGTRLLYSGDHIYGTSMLINTETGKVVVAGPGGDMSLCPPSWRNNEPMIARYLESDGPDDIGGQLTTLANQRIAVVDSGLRSSCIVLASDALTGDPASGPSTFLFGTSSSWLSWHYRELAAGLLVLLAGAIALRWNVRRRRATSPPS